MGLFAQENRNIIQLLMPKFPYTGDRCELKYIFHSDADLFSDKITGRETTSLELDSFWPTFSSMSDKCFVQRVLLERIDREYTLTVFFIPWHDGVIDFPAFNLESLIRVSQNIDTTDASFTVDFDPITINAIAARAGIESMMPPNAPLIVPGTIFILIALAILLLSLIAALIFFILKLPVLLVYFANSKAARRIKKLRKKTIKLMQKLLKIGKTQKDFADYDFCLQLKSILREYFSQRFDFSFETVTTGSLYALFEKIACEKLSPSQESSASEITEIFGRCDYICFAHGSIDSKRQPASIYETLLAEGERELLVERAKKAIILFDSENV